jgi:thymidylate synthase
MNRISLSGGLWMLRKHLLDHGETIKTSRWQDKKNPPEFLEVLHAHFIAKMEQTMEKASEATKASQPWAREHFEERVSGEPMNPPPSHSMWLSQTENHFYKDGKFSHSYPERMWCDQQQDGIRFKFGNLSDAVDLLSSDPTTRQCYVPIWFPEDLSAAKQGQRVPCTLGWHFLLRNGALHCSYHMRSCDAVRHLHNDLYFANCLTIWMNDQCGLGAEIGDLHFSATSLHCFSNDRYSISQLIKK